MKSEADVSGLPLAEALRRFPQTAVVVLADATVRGNGAYRVLRVRQDTNRSEWVVARVPYRPAEEGKDATEVVETEAGDPLSPS